MTTADQYRAIAAQAEAEAAASFERCDTDGFLTQWSQGLIAQLAAHKAKIVDQGNRERFTGLYEGDRRVAARHIVTQYGTRWLLADDEAAKFGRKFLPISDNSRVLKALGLRQRGEWAPAWAKLEGRGTGLGGQCWVETFRTGDKWGADAELYLGD